MGGKPRILATRKTKSLGVSVGRGGSSTIANTSELNRGRRLEDETRSDDPPTHRDLVQLRHQCGQTAKDGEVTFGFSSSDFVLPSCRTIVAFKRQEIID
jgi:hypothetical protein